MNSATEYLKLTVLENSGHVVILCPPVDFCPRNCDGCCSFSSVCVWRLCCKPLSTHGTPGALLLPPKVSDPSCYPFVTLCSLRWVSVLFSSPRLRSCWLPPFKPLESFGTSPPSTTGSLHCCLWSFTVSRIFMSVPPQTHQVMLPKYS